MAFCLFSKVVALYLDNSTAKAFLCCQGDTASTFLSRLTCDILNLANMLGINIHVAYLPTHQNMETYCHREGWFLSGKFFLT